MRTQTDLRLFLSLSLKLSLKKNHQNVISFVHTAVARRD